MGRDGDDERLLDDGDDLGDAEPRLFWREAPVGQIPGRHSARPISPAARLVGFVVLYLLSVPVVVVSYYIPSIKLPASSLSSVLWENVYPSALVVYGSVSLLGYVAHSGS